MRRRVLLVATVVLSLLMMLSTAVLAADDVAAPVTTDDYDGLWHNASVTVNLTAVDDMTGVAGTEYSYDLATWLPGESFMVPATPDHLSDGEHTVSYRSTDVAGNVETPKSCLVKIDTQPPIVSISGSDPAWHRFPVDLSLTGSDVGPADLRDLQYKIDKRAWTSGTTATVKAPSNHSWDGSHKVSYRARDMAGNIGTNPSPYSIDPTPYVTVKIDTKGPACSAPHGASAVRDAYATLKYKVTDKHFSRTQVTIKIKNSSGRTIKTVGPLSKATNKLLSTRVKCSWAPKSYRFYIYAKDGIGNAQSKTGTNTLTVKPPVLTSISATVSDSTPAQYSDVMVRCKCKDQAGRGIKGVRCTFVWHYKTTTPRETHSSGSDGIATCGRYISGATVGYRVVVSITATYRGVTKTTATSFAPH